MLAEVFPIEQEGNIILDSPRRYPTAIRTLARIIGYEAGKGEVDYRAFAKVVPIVALKVCAKAQESNVA